MLGKRLGWLIHLVNNDRWFGVGCGSEEEGREARAWWRSCPKWTRHEHMECAIRELSGENERLRSAIRELVGE